MISEPGGYSMKSRFASLLLLFTIAAQAQPAATAIPPSAESVANRAFEVMAGPAWQTARYFAFTFVVDRDGKTVATFPQRFDRVSGDYRVSGLDPQGKKFDVILNVNTMQGKAWVDGAAVTGDKLAPILATLGYRRYQNDIFWLLMQFKMRDQAVKRAYVGSRDDACGHTWDIIQPSFESGFGFSPNDLYQVWVNRDTGLIDSWDMKLVGSPADEGPVTVMFRDYRRVGGLLISARREIPSKKQTVRLEALQVLPEPPKGAFE
jgi:hypothetical protein